MDVGLVVEFEGPLAAALEVELVIVLGGEESLGADFLPLGLPLRRWTRATVPGASPPRLPLSTLLASRYPWPGTIIGSLLG